MPDILGFLKKAAPWITAAATCNVPALIGMAAQTVGGVVGSKVEATTDSIAAAISGATPEQLQALKQADADLQLKMQAMGFQDAEELEKIAAQDRADARARQIQVKDKLPAVLAICVTAGFFAVLFLAFTKGVNDQSRDLANIMIGTLGTAWVAVITYYFGSSAGSAQKSELLATMEKRKQ
jgi:hypothetical protein